MAVFLQRALTRQSLRVWQKHPVLSRTTVRTSVASLSSQAPLLTHLLESSSQSQNEARGIRAALLAAGGLFMAGAGVLQDQNRTDCCGIAGVVGADHHDARYVYEIRYVNFSVKLWN
jgi:hypothetical protein